MKRTTISLVVVISLLFLALPINVISASPPDDPPPVSDSSSEYILVKFKPGAGGSETAEIHRQLGGKVKKTIPDIGVQVVTVPKGQAKEKAKAYSSKAKVAYAEPDFVTEALGSPDDALFGNQWNMVKVQAPQAWEVTTGSSSINIAILDTGVDQDHPDLASKIISNVNFSGSNTTDDIHGHGTHVAGIAAASTNNGLGVAGLGYDTTIMNVKVLSDTGSGTYSGLAAGIVWAADNGAEIINMSLGGSAPSSTLEDAVNYAWSKGVVVVAAAGNSGNDLAWYPAYYANSIAIAATGANDALASWSNYGDWVDVAAPGASIYSTVKGGSYWYMSGTSMASPHVAGLAALVFTTVSDTDGDGKLNDEVRSRIEATCDDIGVSGIGYGRINAAQAVGDVAPVVPGTITGTITDADDGSAVASATVTDGTRTTTTDAAGEYTIADVPPANYEIVASKAGYESSSLMVTVSQGDTAVADLSLTWIIVPGTITGTVTDAEDGSRIAGATVTDGIRTTTTGASGEYTIADVPPGTYEVVASKEGYESSSLMVTVSEGDTAVADLALTRIIVPGTITGTVTDAEDGSPIAGATVSDASRTMITDASGEYAISDVLTGTYEVTASKSGYHSSSVTVTVLEGNTAVAHLSLTRIIVPGSITGAITDAEDGSPIAGATVTDGTHTVSTDVAGQYAINDVPPGSYEVAASKEGYESSSLMVTVSEGNTAVADLSLTRIIVLGMIAGTVTDAEDGSALVGATVSAGSRTTTTDASGEYTIADVLPGSYDVVASKSGYESSSVTVTVLEGNTAIGNLSLTWIIVPGTITGTVSDAEDDSPIAGATVRDGTRTTTTGASGEYVIADVPPGTYAVTASKSGYESSTSIVTVVSGGTAVMNFSLNRNAPPSNAIWVDTFGLRQCGVNLFVEVKVMSASSVAPGANVALSFECSSGELLNFSGTTDGDGLVRFRLHKPPVGDYVITVTSLTCSGFVWDTSKGITATIYALSR